MLTINGDPGRWRKEWDSNPRYASDFRLSLRNLTLQLVGAPGQTRTYQTVAFRLFWSVDGRVERPEANPCPSIIQRRLFAI